MSTSKGVLVKILGKELQIACPVGKEQELLDAAHNLDQTMTKMRNSGRIIGHDKIAIIAALNATHQQMCDAVKNDSFHAYQEALEGQIQCLENKLTVVLEKSLA